MIFHSNVDLLFCSLRGRGKKAQEAIETGIGKISNVTQTFNSINAKGSFSGSQKAMELNKAQIFPVNQIKLKKALKFYKVLSWTFFLRKRMLNISYSVLL